MLILCSYATDSDEESSEEGTSEDEDSSSEEDDSSREDSESQSSDSDVRESGEEKETKVYNKCNNTFKNLNGITQPIAE